MATRVGIESVDGFIHFVDLVDLVSLKSNEIVHGKESSIDATEFTVRYPDRMISFFVAIPKFELYKRLQEAFSGLFLTEADKQDLRQSSGQRHERLA